MGKKSRRKPRPDAQTAKKQADDTARLERDIAATRRITERFRSPAHWDIYGDHAELLYDETESLKNSRALALESDTSATMDEYYAEVDAMNEYAFLVVCQKYHTDGRTREVMLRWLRRWPKFRPYWRRLRRRVCDYCGKQNDLSEPRFLVCSGCGVARYCGKECQADDFSHHEKCCPLLAQRWSGVGTVPGSLVQTLENGTWDDPAVIPSARARKALLSVIGPENLDKLKKARSLRGGR